MFLFILESIGTQELILVGMVALIVFGPRRLPSMAKKAGGFLKEIRSVSDEFKSTWANEVKKTEVDLGLNDDKPFLPEGTADKINKRLRKPFEETSKPLNVSSTQANPSAIPQVRQISEEDFKKLSAKAKEKPLTQSTSQTEKETWL
ncbi:MAG: twin-arginine translocase TatA/TatE family subunit [Pyrinomonadaceae bacterium]